MRSRKIDSAFSLGAGAGYPVQFLASAQDVTARGIRFFVCAYARV